MSNDLISTWMKTSCYDPRSNSKQKQFKAQRIPNSHKIPFVVMRSTKPLTQSIDVELQTKKRSISRVKEWSWWREKNWKNINKHLTHLVTDNNALMLKSKSGRNNFVNNSPIKTTKYIRRANNSTLKLFLLYYNL